MTSSSIVQRLEPLLQEEGTALVSAYLFGSEAEGRAHAESDVDLAVLVRRDRCADPAVRFEYRLALAARLAAALGGRTLDLIVLNDVPALLARHIVTRGLRLVCTDAQADHAFVRDAQLRAADLEPFVRRMRRIKLERIAGT
jgi:predicted nucleotidyltransferase